MILGLVVGAAETIKYSQLQQVAGRKYESYVHLK